MWRCPTCRANLLDTTTQCPVCTQPTTAASIHSSAASNPSDASEVSADAKFALWLVLGILIPPLGIFFLLVWFAQKLTPDHQQRAK